MKDFVIFTGYVPRSHMPVLYNNSAAFILPTLLETFGQPFVEAMSSGTPVICADTEFAHELCGDTAIYVLPENIQSLADAMAMVVNQPDIADRMRKTGIERATTFSWECEARETLELLKATGNNGISKKDKQRL